MGTCPWTRPTGALPSRHSHDLSILVQWDYAIDLSIRVKVVLSTVWVLTLHVHSRNGEVPVLSRRKAHSCSAVFRPVELVGSDPSFVVFDTLLDEGGEVFIVLITGSICRVQALLEISSRRPKEFTSQHRHGLNGLRLRTSPRPRPGSLELFLTASVDLDASFL
jgi:hypothetical protein